MYINIYLYIYTHIYRYIYICIDPISVKPYDVAKGLLFVQASVDAIREFLGV